MEEQKTELRSIRNRFSALGLTFTALVGFSFVVYFLMLILEARHPEVLNPEAPWWEWLRAFVPTYLVGLPACAVFLKRCLPAQPRECRRLGKKEFLALLCMALGLMVLGNWSMNYPLRLTGKELLTRNPLEDPMRCIAGITLVPLMEELVFRKLLLDRIGHWGRKLAVLMSGVIFALFRLDLCSFLDGFILGAFFAYVYLRTGKVRYTVMLSAIINLYRLVIVPGISAIVTALAAVVTAKGASYGPMLASICGLLATTQIMLLESALSVWGIVLIVRRLRRIAWKSALKQMLRSPCLKVAFVNVGMIVYVALCLILIGLALN